MGITERTIRFHVESIFSKLDVTSRSQAVATAIEHGLPNVV
jgi:DNA-binding NarL/FixJ family response regulator